MRISHASYQKYIESLYEILANEELYSPVLLNYETLLFPLVSNNRKSLVVSLNHRTPLVYLIDDDRFHSSFESPQYLRIKKALRGVKIESICLAVNDNILTLNLLSDDELEGDVKSSLIIELIPLKPNLILIDENNSILDLFYKDKNRELSFGKTYVNPTQVGEPTGEVEINDEFLQNHFNSELEIRRQEKYKNFTNFVNGKIKLINRKIKAIENDVKLAENNLNYSSIADEILCLGLNLKSHVSSVELYEQKVELDSSKTILENVNHFYKKAKKAKETIARSNINIKNAQDEIKLYQDIIEKFNNSNEKQADKLMDEVGMTKKKKEVKETAFNRPYKVNLNGTIIYFGRNANQNDYLSFVMKLNRDFTWMHIKDKSGAHLVIANTKPTEKELIVASEIALICSHSNDGEVVYTVKKNVRRGHVLGEAILKNHSTIKLNSVSKETKELFLTAERLK